MNITEAINASSYDAAAREGGVLDVIVSPDGHDGLYGVVAVDASGNVSYEVHSKTLAEVEQSFPGENWWPLRDNGEWGEGAEAQYGGN